MILLDRTGDLYEILTDAASYDALPCIENHRSRGHFERLRGQELVHFFLIFEQLFAWLITIRVADVQHSRGWSLVRVFEIKLER